MLRYATVVVVIIKIHVVHNAIGVTSVGERGQLVTTQVHPTGMIYQHLKKYTGGRIAFL